MSRDATCSTGRRCGSGYPSGMAPFKLANDKQGKWTPAFVECPCRRAGGRAGAGAIRYTGANAGTNPIRT